MNRSVLSACLMFVAAGCDTTAPPLPDPAPTPYLVGPTGVRVFGVTRIPVIPAMFAGGALPPMSPAVLHQNLFGNRDDGVVARAYGVASESRFALRGHVSPWIQTTVTRQQLSDEFLTQAILGADAHLDFGQFDSDGPDGIPNSGDDDGIVDGGVVIVIPERDLSCPTPGPGIHPHARLNWNVGNPPAPLRTQDPSANGGTIGVRAYTLMSAIDCDGTRVNGAPMAHELGHVLFGVADFYHEVAFISSTERWRGRRWVMGCWELMAAGSGWGCGSGPPAASRFNATFGAWSRHFIGWSQPVEVTPDASVVHELRAVGRGGTVLSLSLGPQERILIEYRQRTNGDVVIPEDGVLMYHVVDTLPFRPDSAAPRKYRVMLIEADGDGALKKIHAEGGNRGMPGDAFGNGVNELTPGVHPEAVRADGTPLPFRVHDITLDRGRGVARLRVSPAITP